MKTNIYILFLVSSVISNPIKVANNNRQTDITEAGGNQLVSEDKEESSMTPIQNMSITNNLSVNMTEEALKNMAFPQDTEQAKETVISKKAKSKLEESKISKKLEGELVNNSTDKVFRADFEIPGCPTGYVRSDNGACVALEQ